MQDTDFGPLKLTFDGRRVVLLGNAADGEMLRVRMEAWEDPFAGPLSDENRDFVAESGKWTAFEVSARVPLRRSSVTSSTLLSQFSPGLAK